MNAHWLYATTCLGPQGRLDEALTEARPAETLDPLFPLTHSMVGAVYFFRREFDAALASLKEALRLDPSFEMASLFQMFVYLAEGRTDIAAASDHQGACRAYIEARQGNTAAAQKQIDKRRPDANPIGIAAGYVALGQQEKHSTTWRNRWPPGSRK